MTMVHAYPSSSSADIARLTMLTPQTISLIVANLERAGRLTRSQNPEHGRIQCMVLTEPGRALLATCRERVAVIEAKISAGLTPAEEQILRRWLVDLASRDLS
jgi:DNA-binding MarR family transcriptional regulator